jgi:hypothetical protein
MAGIAAMIAVPPRGLIAHRPEVPSSSAPVRTMPMARRP